MHLCPGLRGSCAAVVTAAFLTACTARRDSPAGDRTSSAHAASPGRSEAAQLHLARLDFAERAATIPVSALSGPVPPALQAFASFLDGSLEHIAASAVAAARDSTRRHIWERTATDFPVLGLSEYSLAAYDQLLIADLPRQLARRGILMHSWFNGSGDITVDLFEVREVSSPDTSALADCTLITLGSQLDATRPIQVECLLGFQDHGVIALNAPQIHKFAADLGALARDLGAVPNIGALTDSFQNKYTMLAESKNPPLLKAVVEAARVLTLVVAPRIAGMDEHALETMVTEFVTEHELAHLSESLDPNLSARFDPAAATSFRAHYAQLLKSETRADCSVFMKLKDQKTTDVALFHLAAPVLGPRSLASFASGNSLLMLAGGDVRQVPQLADRSPEQLANAAKRYLDGEPGSSAVDLNSEPADAAAGMGPTRK